MRVRTYQLSVFKFFIRTLSFIGLLSLLIACSQASKNSEQNSIQKEEKRDYVISRFGDTIQTGVPIPIEGIVINPDSVAPPEIVPINKHLKEIPIHQNIYPLDNTKKIEASDNIAIAKPGENGIPLPKSIEAQGKIVPVIQPTPQPANSFSMNDNAKYDIRYLDLKKGLSSEQVNDMLLDSRGHLWFATMGGGVSRYDGTTISHFTEQHGLSENMAHCIYEDSKGHIWFGTESKGVSRYDGEKFTYFNIEQGIDINRVFSILEDSNGDYWFGMYGKGLCHFKPNKDGLGGIFTYYNKENGLPFNFIYKILEDKNGHIWFINGQDGQGIGRYIPKKAAVGTFTHFTEENGIRNYVYSLLEDSQDRLWFGTYNGSLSQYMPTQDKDHKETANLNSNKLNHFQHFLIHKRLLTPGISVIFEDSQNQFWVGTNRDGVYRFNPKDLGNEGEILHLNIDNGLTDNRITKILEDPSGNIWISTASGVCRYDPNGFEYIGVATEMDNNAVSSIYEDKQGDIWFGTGAFGMSGKGAFRFSPKKASFTNFTSEDGLSFSTILAITEDKRGNIWFGGPGGAGYYDEEKFVLFYPEQGLGWWFTFSIKEDSHGDIWVGSDVVTRFTFDKETTPERIIQYKEGKGKRNKTGVQKIIFDSKDNFWGTTPGNGVYRFKNNEDQKSGLGTFFSTNEGLSHDWVMSGMESSNGKFWWGTLANGLNIFNPTKETFEYFSQKDGLSDDFVTSIIEDKQNRIWVSTQKSIGLFVPKVENQSTTTLKDYQFYNFGLNDGLKQLTFNTSFLDSQNKLWWGTGKGVVRLDLNTFQLPTKAPQNVQLSHIDLQQKNIDYRQLKDTTYSNQLAFGAALKESIDSTIAFQNYPATLDLPYDLNHLTFHFSAIDWAAPHKIKYSYYLEGLEKDWNEPTTESKADYRNLPHGNFTLKVKAIGEAQIWSEVFEYDFKILPPWWHTWWAYTLYAILAIGTAGWYIRRMQRKLAKEQKLNTQLTNLNKANSRFVPNDFLQILAKESILDLKLGDQTATKMTVLFADIRDYTTISETMTPEQNFKFINAYLGQMGPIIKNHGGFICQYFGDGIMALFKNDHEKAVIAAIEMQQTLNFYNETREEQGKQAIQVGIGLNTGQLMLGVIGDEDRYDSSVISDAVNTAARMEGLTKIFGCMLIISEPTLQELLLLDDFPSSSNLDSKEKAKLLDNGKISSNMDYAYRFLGKVKVKGKKVALNIYDFYDGDPVDIQQLKTATKADFEKALHLYFDKEFGKAADLLKVVLDKYPADKAAQYYFDKAVQYVTVGVGETWSGVEEMVSK